MKKRFLLTLFSMFLLASCGPSAEIGPDYSDKEPEITSVFTTPKKLDLTVGPDSDPVTVSIIGKYSYDKTVLVESANTEVATVNKTQLEALETFIVSPVAEGSTTINLKSAADETKVASVEVNVTDASSPMPEDPDKITLVETSQTIKVGDTYTVVVNESRGGDVVWSIDLGGETIIEFDNTPTNTSAVIKGLSTGTATVRAVCGEASATCEITVNEVIPVNRSLYFTNNYGWSDVYIYLTSEDGSTHNAAFPGEKMINPVDNDFGEAVYSFDVDTTEFTKVSFNNGTNSKQTTDIIIDNISSNLNDIYVVGDSSPYDVSFAEFVAPTASVSFLETSVNTYVGVPQVVRFSSEHCNPTFTVTEGSSNLTAAVVAGSDSELLLTPSATGTAVIEAKNGQDVLATLNVTISERPAAAVTLDKETITLEEFTSGTINSTVADTWDIEWTMSGEAGVITFDGVGTNSSIKFNALKVGAVTITATVKGTDTSDSVEVTVTESQATKDYYFSNNKGWKNVYLYAWNSTNSNAEWPGVMLNEVIKNDLDQDVYNFRLNPLQYSNMILNDGNDVKTKDIELGWFDTAEKDNVWSTELINGAYDIEIGHFVEKAEKTASFGELEEVTISIDQIKRISVESTTHVDYRISSGGEHISIIATNNRYLGVRGLTEGDAVIEAVVNSVAVDSITIHVQEKNTKTYYYINAFDNWGDLSVYAYGADNVQNAAWPGEEVTLIGKEAYGRDVYSFELDANVYTHFQLVANQPSGEQAGEKQTRPIAISEFGENNAVSFDTVKSWTYVQQYNVYQAEPYFETYHRVAFGIHNLEVGVNKSKGATIKSVESGISYEIIEGDEFIDITIQNDSGITVKGIAVGTAKIKATCGADSDILEVSVVASTEKTFYFATTSLYDWTDYKVYAFGSGDVKNAEWPGETLTQFDEKEAYGRKVYSFTLDTSLYTKFVLTAKENGDLKQTRDILLSEFGTNNMVSFASEQEAWKLVENTWRCDPYFETYKDVAFSKSTADVVKDSSIAVSVNSGATVSYEIIEGKSNIQILESNDSEIKIKGLAIGTAKIKATANGFESILTINVLESIPLKRIYLQTKANDIEWNKDNVALFAYAWGGGLDPVGIALTCENMSTIYYVDLDPLYTNVLFVRMSEGSTFTNFSNYSGTIFNQTVDLTIPSDKNLFSFTSWDAGNEGKSTGTWDFYIHK